HHQKRWAAEEDQDFRQGYKHDIDEPLTNDMSKAFKEKVRPVLRQSPSDRDGAEREAAVAVLAEQRRELEAWLDQLNKLGPYASKEVSDRREKAVGAVKERLDLYARAEECLRAGAKFPVDDAQELTKRIAATPELREKTDRVALPNQESEERR